MFDSISKTSCQILSFPSHDFQSNSISLKDIPTVERHPSSSPEGTFSLSQADRILKDKDEGKISESIALIHFYFIRGGVCSLMKGRKRRVSVWLYSIHPDRLKIRGKPSDYDSLFCSFAFPNVHGKTQENGYWSKKRIIFSSYLNVTYVRRLLSTSLVSSSCFCLFLNLSVLGVVLWR